MRLLLLIGGMVLAVALVLGSGVLQPAPAAARLAGVNVSVTGYTIQDLGDRRHRLNLQVRIASQQALEACLAFALDEPFAARKLTRAADSSDCLRPTAGALDVGLAFDRLTDDDLQFPSHTLVWGIDGGRCGPILLAFGVCVVEMAGTAPVELPRRSVLPSFGPIKPIGSLFPLFSFAP
jgi:hypothetical protein